MLYIISLTMADMAINLAIGVINSIRITIVRIVKSKVITTIINKLCTCVLWLNITCDRYQRENGSQHTKLTLQNPDTLWFCFANNSDADVLGHGDVMQNIYV